MIIRGLEDAFWFRASILAEKYSIPIDKARLLKGGGIVDVAADKARRMIEDGLAEPIDTVAEIDEEDKVSDNDKEDL